MDDQAYHHHRQRNYRPVRVYNSNRHDGANSCDAESRPITTHAREGDRHHHRGPALGRAGPWLYAACLLLWGAVLAQAHPAAKRLHDDLLSEYNRLIRPVGNHSHKVIIHLGLKLSQLIDIVSRLIFL